MRIYTCLNIYKRCTVKETAYGNITYQTLPSKYLKSSSKSLLRCFSTSSCFFNSTAICDSICEVSMSSISCTAFVSNISIALLLISVSISVNLVGEHDILDAWATKFLTSLMISICSLIRSGSFRWSFGRLPSTNCSPVSSNAYTTVVVSHSCSFPSFSFSIYICLLLLALTLGGNELKKKVPLALSLCHVWLGNFMFHCFIKHFLKYFGKISKTSFVIFIKFSSSSDDCILNNKSRMIIQIGTLGILFIIEAKEETCYSILQQCFRSSKHNWRKLLICLSFGGQYTKFTSKISSTTDK